MGRIEKTVFISYRRTNVPWALAIYQDLTHHGYDVFFDYQSIPSGSFEQVIHENIRTRAHFIVILTPSALERCREPGDWLRREIETAMDERRNIVPLMLESFDFESPLVKDALTGKLASLSAYNGLRVYAEYFFPAMDKLRESFLNIALSDVALPPVTVDVREITAAQKSSANAEPPVEKKQLTAQEWFERGYVNAAETNNPEEALRCFTEAIRLDPGLDTAYYNLALLLSNLERYEEAETAYRKAIELDPTFFAAQYNLGLLLSNLGRHEEAEAAYRKAIELDPVDASAYNNLGTLLIDLKRFEEAEPTLRKAVELDPTNADAYYNLGVLLRKLGRNEEAEAAYRKAIELNPADVKTYNNLGVLLADVKRYEEAETTHRQAVELDPANTFVYNNLGVLLRNVERYDEAEAALRKAIDLDPANANAYHNLGVLLKALQHYDEAGPILRKAIELDTSLVGAYVSLAALIKQGGAEVSAEVIEHIRRLMPGDAWYILACLESVCDNIDLAAEYLQRAADHGQIDPKWALVDPDLQWIRPDPRFEKIVGPHPE